MSPQTVSQINGRRKEDTEEIEKNKIHKVNGSKIGG